MIGVLLAFATTVSAQSRMRAVSATPILKEPGGIRLGSLVSGQSYSVGRARGVHIETTVDGWIPAAAVQATTRDGFDLTIIAGSGESLRAAPSGNPVARVQEGTLLSKVATRGTWVRVRRAGWVAKSALVAESQPIAGRTVPPSPVPPPAPAPALGAASPPASTGSPQIRDTSASSPDARAGAAVAATVTLRPGAAIAPTPDGIPIGSIAAAATEVEVLERNRDWVKVRLEGWVKAADITAEATPGPAITAAMLREHPDRYLGQTVAWRLQFLAVQVADALRPEMPAGQDYILARGPLPESGFTYLMVSKDQAAEFRRLAPLDEVKVEAIIRAGRTKYLPTPVLELVKVTR